LLPILNPYSWEGYQPRFQYNPPVPKFIGWSIPEDGNLAFVDPNNYTNAAIACHIGATPAPLSAPAQAGATVSLEWNPWNPGHKGPVITYLANCKGPCETVDPLALEFFKIDELGLLGQPDGHYHQGHWASDKVLEANSTWTLQLPKDIAAGNYVLRHEIIALHGAHLPDGAQNYPQCINLQIQGSGTANPKGVPATELYTPDSVHYDIWIKPLPTYMIPGPPLYTGGAGGGSGNSSGTPVISSSTAVAPSIPSGFVTSVSTASSSALPSATAPAIVAAIASKAEPVNDTCEL